MAQQGVDADTAMNQSGTYGNMLTTQQKQLAYEVGAAKRNSQAFGWEDTRHTDESLFGESDESILTETEEGDRVEIEKVPSIVMPIEMEDALKQHGLSPDEFDALRLKDVSELKEHEITVLKAIRESIPAPTADTVLQKVIPATDVEKYLNGSYTKVGGFISRYGDVSHLKTYREYYGGLRLDYPNSKYNPQKDTILGTIEFSTPDVSMIKTPYGPEMGGTETDPPPFTGNGFTKAKNGQVIPEYKAEDYMKLKDGAKLYTVDQYGTKTLRAVYDMDEQKFVSINKGGQ